MRGVRHVEHLAEPRRVRSRRIAHRLRVRAERASPVAGPRVVPEIPLRVEHPRVAQLRRHRLRLRQSHDGFQPRTLAARVGNDRAHDPSVEESVIHGLRVEFGDSHRHPDALEVLPGPVHQFPGQHVPRHVRENHGRIVSASALRAKLLAQTRRVAQSRRQPHARDLRDHAVDGAEKRKRADERAARRRAERERGLPRELGDETRDARHGADDAGRVHVDVPARTSARDGGDDVAPRQRLGDDTGFLR